VHLGAVNSAQGAGIVIGGFILSLWGGFRRRLLTSMLGWAGVGVGSLLLGLAPESAFWIAVAGMFTIGLMLPIGSGPMMAVYQSAVAPDMQGRFFTLNASINNAIVPLGLLVAGLLADRFGVRLWWALTGIGHILLALGCLLTPSILHLEDHTDRTGERQYANP
jgi:DHA3 family macrolide efflux protein-like MFS transporter